MAAKRPPLKLEPRRRRPSAADPSRELRERTVHDGLKVAMYDAIQATLLRLDGPPDSIVDGSRRWLTQLLGRIETCRSALAIRDRACGESFLLPLSCRVRGCPDCETARQARLVRVFEAVIGELGGEERCSFAVLTAANPRFGDLKAELRAFTKRIARLRRAAPFAGGPCTWPGHPAGYVHPGVGGGFSSVECPPSTGTRGTWNLHANLVFTGTRTDPQASAPFIPWAELSWWWRRINCDHHGRRCPGLRAGADHCRKCAPSSWAKLPDNKLGGCAGGAWEVNIAQLKPGKVREALKYATKPAELLDVGAAAFVEWLLATRGVKLVAAWGSFRGRDVTVDPVEQALADQETVDVWVSEFTQRSLPRVCPFHGGVAEWSDSPLFVSRLEARLKNGALVYRPSPPHPPPRRN